jgi:PBSX family phage terminase large subunit
LFDGEGLGIKHFPEWQARTEMIDGKKVKFRQRIFEGKYEGSDALILLPKYKSGQSTKYIVAFGGNKSNSHEPYKGWSVGMFIATQWELLHLNTRDELLKRTALSRHRKHFTDLNPISPKADIYKQIARWQATGQLNYIKKTMLDNPIMTPERIEEIKAEYDPDSIVYKRDILGERVAAEGLIYRLRDYNILKESEFRAEDYVEYVIVADPGINASATAFCLLGITRGYRYVDVILDYNHKNEDKAGLAIKMPSDYVMDYFDFIKGSKKKMNKSPRDVYSDLDLTFKREYERLQWTNGVQDQLRNAIKDEIVDRIKTDINLLYKGRLRFYENCVSTIESFRTAQYDPKLSDKGVYVRYDSPVDGTMIDNIDNVEYGIRAFRYELSLYKGV